MKDIVSRIAQDARRVGPAHQGSALKSPLTSQQIAAEIYKLPSFTWSIPNPVVSGAGGPYFQSERTMVQINADVIGTGSVTFNVEIRTSLGTTGTKIFAADVTVTNAGAIWQAFTVTDLPLGTRLYLNITNVTGIVTAVAVTCTTTGGLSNGSSGSYAGNGTAQYQTITTGATPFAPVYSGYLLDGTTGGKFRLMNRSTWMVRI